MVGLQPRQFDANDSINTQGFCSITELSRGMKSIIWREKRLVSRCKLTSTHKLPDDAWSQLFLGNAQPHTLAVRSIVEFDTECRNPSASEMIHDKIRAFFGYNSFNGNTN